MTADKEKRDEQNDPVAWRILLFAGIGGGTLFLTVIGELPEVRGDPAATTFFLTLYFVALSVVAGCILGILMLLARLPRAAQPAYRVFLAITIAGALIMGSAYGFRDFDAPSRPSKPAACPVAPDAPPLAATDLEGPAETVDGDTLRLGDTRIRLHGVDAPERETPAGLIAWRALDLAIAGGPVACAPIDTDRYGRTVARCTAAGADLALAQLAAGRAVVWPRYLAGHPHEAAYRKAETEARENGCGLWGR